MERSYIMKLPMLATPNGSWMIKVAKMMPSIVQKYARRQGFLCSRFVIEGCDLIMRPVVCVTLNSSAFRMTQYQPHSNQVCVCDLLKVLLLFRCSPARDCLQHFVLMLRANSHFWSSGHHRHVIARLPISLSIGTNQASGPWMGTDDTTQALSTDKNDISQLYHLSTSCVTMRLEQHYRIRYA